MQLKNFNRALLLLLLLLLPLLMMKNGIQPWGWSTLLTSYLHWHCLGHFRCFGNTERSDHIAGITAFVFQCLESGDSLFERLFIFESP